MSTASGITSVVNGVHCVRTEAHILIIIITVYMPAIVLEVLMKVRDMGKNRCGSVD